MINNKLAGFSLGGWLMGDFNNRLLFSLLFSGNFFLVGQGLDEEGESRDSSPSVPTRENPDWCSQHSVCMSTPP